jgi:cytochrome b561/polyisoprenoid-binding protein YceI
MTEPARDPAAVGSGRYPLIAILLHWLIAAAIVLQVVLAGRMEGPRTPTSFAVTQLHKSIGITILLLSLVRLGWRLLNPPPPLPATMPRWERELARITHVGFYVIMIGMPLTGWIMVSASRIALPTLLFGQVPWPNLPLGDLAPAAKRLWHEIGETGHGLLAKVIYVLLALHVAGALKHQLFSRDEPVLARMAPGAVAGRWREPRILIILLAFVAVIAFGKLLTPPSPGMKPPPPAVTPLSPAQEPAEAQGPGEPAARDTQPSPNPSGPMAGKSPTAAIVPAAPAAPAAEAQPARWVVNPGSSVQFATQWSGQALEGRFDRFRADIRFDPAALDRSSARVTIDLASVKTGDAQRDAALPAPDWFDTAAHPQAVFTADRFEATGPDRYVARGQLQLRGVRRPVTLPFALHITGDKARMSGVTSLDRTAFGVGQGEWAKTDQIPAKVTVTVALRATRQG